MSFITYIYDMIFRHKNVNSLVKMAKNGHNLVPRPPAFLGRFLILLDGRDHLAHMAVSKSGRRAWERG